MSQELGKSSVSRQAMEEALSTAAEALRNIELSEIPLANIALKAARICRILGYTETRKVFEMEVSGYKSSPDGLTLEEWRLAKAAGRVFKKKDLTGATKEYAYIESIDELETQVKSANLALTVANDPNIHLASANPYQQVAHPLGNKVERQNHLKSIQSASKRLSERKAFIYRFLLERYNQLKFSSQVGDFFANVRLRVDQDISQVVPGSAEQIASIIDDLRSSNAVNWSNAVHTCRRLLQLVADAVFPATDVVRNVPGSTRKIRLGADNYINRLVCFVEDHSDSSTYSQVVGSSLEFIGNRLDAIFQASQRGSHRIISDKYEAERYAVYTYMCIGDILSLATEVQKPTEEPDGSEGCIAQEPDV